jgi:guanosine-3',5'-bis(diphosphate) 3'-pyrophosphohydrolase
MEISAIAKQASSKAGSTASGEAGRSSPLLQRALDFRRQHGATDAPMPEIGMHCILHPADVSLLLQEAGESDPFLLTAAMLHDMLQVAEVSETDIAGVFGSEVAYIIAEVTDNPRLSKVTRKALRITIAPHLSRKARLLKLAQLVASVRNLAGAFAPPSWDAKQRIDFFDWVERFADTAGVVNPTLQAIMLAELERGRLSSGAAIVTAVTRRAS